MSLGVTTSVAGQGTGHCVRAKPPSPRGRHRRQLSPRRPDHCRLGPAARELWPHVRPLRRLTGSHAEAGEWPRLLIPEGSSRPAGRRRVGTRRTAAPRGRPAVRDVPCPALSTRDSPGMSRLLRFSPSVLRRLHSPRRCCCSVLRSLATRGGHPGPAMASECPRPQGSSTARAAWPRRAPGAPGPWAALVSPLSAEPACGHGTQARVSRVFSSVTCGLAAFQGAPRPHPRGPVFLRMVATRAPAGPRSLPPGRGRVRLLCRSRGEGGAHAVRTPS